MPTEVAKALKVPGFSYRGFAVPNLTLGAELIDNLGTGEPAYKLAPKSAPLSDRVALYIVGRDLAIEEPLASDLPDSVKEAGRLVYEGCQARQGRGCWHKDGVLYLRSDENHKGATVPSGFVPAKYFKDIIGFNQEGDAWKINPSPQTEEFNVFLPESDAFIVPTMDGAYNPLTGTPFETIKDRSKAIKRWLDADLTEEQAEKELSRFYRRNEGTAAVYSWSDANDGPLCVDLDHGPGDRCTYLGSFPASRAAERSEAPKNSGFRTVTEAEYKALVADKETLDAVRKRVGK